MSYKGWIAVDLDGTLAEYNGWVNEEHIGAPIPAMLERVKLWLAEGKDVRIFTARVDGGEVALAMGNAAGERFRDVQRIKGFIEAWCLEHLGQALPITNRKDYGMVELWDDRCVQVIPNTGQRADALASSPDPAREALVGALKGLWDRHKDGSEEEYWAEWDTADDLLCQLGIIKPLAEQGHKGATK